LRGAADIPARFDASLGTACLALLAGPADGSLAEALLTISDELAARVLAHAHTQVNDALQRASVNEPDEAPEGEPTEGAEPTAATEGSRLVEIVAERLDDLQTRLGEHEMMNAMAAATTLALRSGQIPVEQATFNHLAKLAPIQDQALCDALLDIAPGYVSSGWTNQIGLLDVETLKSLPNVSERLGRLGALLWRRSMQPDDARRDSDDRRAAGLAALKKLVDAGAPLDRTAVAEAVGASLSGPFVTNADVDAQSRMVAIGEEFVAAGILDRQALVDSDLACCADTLASEQAPDQPETEHVPQALYSRIVGASSEATVPSLDTILAAIPSSQLLSEPLRASLPMVLSAHRRRLDPQTQSPIDPEQLAQLRAQHGDLFDPAIAAWLDAFDPTPDEVWRALADVASGPVPDTIAGALHELAGRRSAKERFELARPALEDSDRVVGPAFLRAIRFTEADQAQAAAAIIRTVEGDNVPAQLWDRALALWGELKPTGQPTQERLIQSVYLPAVRSGREGVDIAITHFGLVSHQRSKVRSEIIDELSGAAVDDDQRRRVENRLKDAGWLKRGGILGLGAVKKADGDSD